MNIKDYKFKVGDEVITTSGTKGVITLVCDCDKCKRRGFYEPIWMECGAEYDSYISIFDAERGFPGFYRIGDYRFNDFDKDTLWQNIDYHNEALKKIRGRLRVIEEIEKQESEE